MWLYVEFLANELKIYKTYNKKTWETLNVYFSNKLRFEQKLYHSRLGLITRETKMSVASSKSFIF